MGRAILKDLRTLPGFFPHYTVIKVHDELHAQLRATIGEPIIPNDNLINELKVVQRGVEGMSQLDRLDRTIDYLGKVAAQPGAPTPNTRDAWDLLENLQVQRPYLVLGRVTLLTT